MQRRIDLNSDLGEGYGAWTMGEDAALLQQVSSASVACGFHAGDPGVMQRTVRMAAARGVAIGAHPALPDLQGFGRREMRVSAAEVYDLVLYQIGALGAFCRASKIPLCHVKPHGALYNMAARDAQLARAIAQAVHDYDTRLVLYGLANSALIEAGLEAGLVVANEVFADRTYQADGSLTPRTRPDALIHEVATALAQVERMIFAGEVVATDGSHVPIQADTLCLHGDGPAAVELASALRRGLEARGVAIRPVACAQAGSGEM
ncbi:MAG: LamB/YcsF family protein [Burkholderiales bacterium]|nr:LamB/YcsF family protein [Burkholderiales bacterium]